MSEEDEINKLKREISKDKWTAALILIKEKDTKHLNILEENAVNLAITALEEIVKNFKQVV